MKTPEMWRRRPSEGTVVSLEIIENMLDDLLEHELSTAPHVLRTLVVELNADLPTVREVVAHLAPQQRHGLRPLPAPLPLVPPIANEFADLRFTDADRDLLLAAALCLEDRLDPVLEFAARSAHEIVAGPVGQHLTIHAGRFRFADPRLAIWLRETTASAVQVDVHERLGAIFGRRGEQVSADWHRARSSLRGDPSTASELIRIARELSEGGDADRALLLAAEAASHAVGVERDDARLVAGAAAIGAGYAAEASGWLGSLFPDGTERYRLQGLGGLVVALAHLHGDVPDIDATELRPRTDDHDDWYAWTKAAALAAVLCAERGDRSGMRSWLDALRDGCARVGAESRLRDPVVALSWLLVGERETTAAEGTGPVSGSVLGALRAALDDDIDGGLRILANGEGTMGAEIDPFVAGFEYSPLVQAYRAVTETLLLTWRGDISQARQCLIAAAVVSPVAIPFAGLAVALARRLDLAVLGTLSPFARSLTAALPSGLRVERLVDRGIEAYLDGAFAKAAAFLRLWQDRGAPEAVFGIPGLDEVAPAARERTPRRVEPGEEDSARRLCARVIDAPEGRWRAEFAEVHVEARALRSPFARARVEALIGIHTVIHGERMTGRRHLGTARNLFEDAGAAAWAAAMERRIERLGPADGGVGAEDDHLAACRRAWETQLTVRELEVAMLVVGGTMNREIAERLNVSVRTVEVHVGRLLAKFDVRTRVELTALAHRTDQFL
ncbi:helix-turn-helix transcriptional regulator [Microbacterium sp. LWO13-1.2]|uniref:helix-turn-helix transcriptional regulator n=1 Tax=Microbacterium sp. LWO13-1.2 TaxID=3135262 RepID=UPI003139EA04